MHSLSNVRRTALAAVIGAAFCAGASLLPATAHAAGAWAGTATQAMPLKGFSVSPLAASQQMHVVLGLNARNKAQLDALVAQIGKPGSAMFGKTITPAQFLATYAPTADQANAVVSYLRSLGFSNIEVSGNRLTVSAYGSAAAVQQAFNTQLVSFVTQGRTLFANAAPAQVPASLGGVVAAVIGLNNMGGMTTNLQHTSASKPVGPTRSISTVRPNAGVPQDPILTPPYGGPQYQTAYDAGKTPTGWGTTIGIITEGDITQVPKDLRAYEKEWNLPQVPVEIVPTGFQTSDAAGLDEWDLDSQSSSGIAGNLKKIIFYNGGSLADVDIAPAIERAVSENRAKAVNMSFGGCETTEYLSGAMLVEDLAFEQGSAQGMTFFGSSGDGGASCQVLINAGQPVLLGAVEYPAASPYVVAVGGTSLLTNADYTYNSELSWVSGGGGISLWEGPGIWTNGVINPVNTTAFQRAVPDIAMVGDPNIGGADVVVNGSDTGVGGTSLSSPLSVGVWARMQTAHGNCYGFAAPIFYATYGQPYGSAAKFLHDIVLGDNFLYPATPGWDYDTGMGSFDIAAANTALPPVSCAPAAPDSLTAGVISGTVMLNWSPVAGATSYAIYEGSAAGAEGSTPVATSTNTNTLIKGLGSNATYYFTVKAVNAAGSSAASNEASATLPPAAPTSLKAASSGGGVVALSWTGSTGASSYEVYQGTASGAEGATAVKSGVTGTSTTISGLKTGTTYYFTVDAVGATGTSAQSAETSVTVTAAPAAPTGVVARPGSTTGSLFVAWGLVTGITHYNVYLGTTAGGESSTVAATTGSSNTTITGLVSGKTYYVQVTAVSSGGIESARSAEASYAAR
jgi:subtilase family serine protease